ncbi:MAG: response regulator [Methyloprofundus sp.]|nr:response regulator [Methyloprofundus sp.]
MPKIYKILVVDDSKVIRRKISELIESCEDMTVIGEAESGESALRMIPQLSPDVVTLDINMPGMNGLTTLKHIMLNSPVATVMLSSLTREGALVTFDALRYGSIDFVFKPTQLEGEFAAEQKQRLLTKIRLASLVKIDAIQYIRAKQTPKSPIPTHSSCQKIVVLGVAEGGYSSLLKIIPKLAVNSSTAYMVILYEASQDVKAFTHYLNRYSKIPVTHASNNTLLKAGVCYINSGEEYVTVHEDQGDLISYVSQAPFSSQRGSINMLMFSVAEVLTDRAAGVILSGAGSDGSEGLEEITRVGGLAIIQSPRTCLYKEMALAALDVCEAEQVMSDSEIASQLTTILDD